MKLVLILLTLIAFLFPSLESARILGIFPMPGVSHNILTTKLMKGLIAAGHNVTVISTFPMKDIPENGTLNEIVLEGFVEKFESVFSGSGSMFAIGEKGMLNSMSKMIKIFVDFSNDTFHNAKVQKLLKSDQKFDAIVLEQFSNDAMNVFAYVYNCPLIILNSMGANSRVNSMVGNDAPVSYVGNMMKGDFSRNLSLYNRATNLFFILVDVIVRYFFILPSQEALMHEWYPNSPPLMDLYSNVSLVLLNSHTSLYPALPLVPNMVEIGGYFIDPPKKLPSDLQEVLDNSEEGVIYFSMGSVLKSKEMPEEKKQAIINVFGRLKMKVLWKFEEDLPNKPNNVIIRKWFPQQDILTHPNIKLFITHGGLLSSTETIYHGVPVLAVPVFGDQDSNADRVVNNGIGLKLAFRDFTEEKFEKAIIELLYNSKYRENIQSKSKIFHDRPEHPLKTAVYWIEYVIRHQGAPHLRVAGVHLPLYKYYMLDVFVVVLLAVIVVFNALKLLLRKVCLLIRCKKLTPKQKSN